MNKYHIISYKIYHINFACFVTPPHYMQFCHSSEAPKTSKIPRKQRRNRIVPAVKT